ncbi:hypothetical protein AMJ44_11690, partial [candidate division WOR-1 bacterium DG_54_3]
DMEGVYLAAPYSWTFTTIDTSNVETYTFNLVSGINWISVPLINSNITNAQELWAAMGLAPGDLIEEPDSAGSAGFSNYYGGEDDLGVIGTNFAVTHGKCYRVTTAVARTWTLTGDLPASEDNLFNLAVPGIHWIYLPLSKSGITSASALWANPDGLGLVNGDLIEAPAPGLASFSNYYGGEDDLGVIGTDFAVSVGKPYRITTANPIISTRFV